MSISNTFCPCDLQEVYTQCCGRYHAGELAPDALALMRSRYSAYVLQDERYLRESWHVDTCPVGSIIEDAPSERTQWLGLSIQDFKVTGEATAEVVFVARYRVGGGRAVRMQEHSRFVCEQGRWLYVNALS